jgi:DNA-binding IclR family transcriptional regulator
MKKTVATTRKGSTADQSLLARAFRWQKLLENGTYTSIAEIARAEEINDSYVSRLLLTLLAPEIVETILDGRHYLAAPLAADVIQCSARLRP